MIDPFSAWARLLSASFEMQRTWLQTAQTWQASGEVIDARMKLLGEAGRAPFTADLAELSRMVPEKVDAFSRSGAAFARGMIAMQAAWWAQGQRITALWLTGKMPSPGAAVALAGSGARSAIRATEAASRLGVTTLAPVHRTATGNARRLRRTGKTRRRPS